MSNGTHVTKDMCKRIRDGFDTPEMMARELGISEKALWYHRSGECCHNHSSTFR